MEEITAGGVTDSGLDFKQALKSTGPRLSRHEEVEVRREVADLMYSFRRRATELKHLALFAQFLIAVSIFGGIYTFGFASQIAAEAKFNELKDLTQTVDKLVYQRQATEAEIVAQLPSAGQSQSGANSSIGQASSPQKPPIRIPGDANRLSTFESRLAERKDETDEKAIQARRSYLDGQLNLARAAEEAARQRLIRAVSPANDEVILTITTKVGSVLLLLFFVRILVSIFRYYIRLSMFYQSRADALSITRATLPLSVSELAAIVSPEKVEFEKAIDAPEEVSLPMVKELAALRGKGSAPSHE